MGVYNSAIDLGLFVGPLLGGGAAAVINPRAPFFVALPLGLAAVIMTLTTGAPENSSSG
jgi:predicted MFS family arabinose efflux permease